MHTKYYLYLSVLVCCLMSNPLWAGEQEAIKNMANILMHLNHYPSDAEKKQLRNMAANSDSEHVKILATAMVNMEHSATAADKRKLKQLMDDKSASEQEKTLASILYNLHHKPSRADKQALSTMINLASDM